MSFDINPSWHSDFAQSDHEAMYPELWSGLVDMWAPILGPTNDIIYDFVGHGMCSTNNTWTLANDYVWADYQSGQYGDAGDIIDFTSGDSFSIVAFVAGNGGNYGHAFGRRSFAAGYQYSLGSSSTGKVRILYSGGSVDSTFSIVANEPTIIAATHTSATTELYHNNSYFSASSPTITHVAANCHLGALDTGSNYFGRVGYVLVYNYVIQAGLIRTLVDDPYALFRTKTVVPSTNYLTPTESVSSYSWYDIVEPTA